MHSFKKKSDILLVIVTVLVFDNKSISIYDHR